MSPPSTIVRGMEWIAPVVAVVAALIAGWQAWEARRSRLDARSSASEAQQHEERAAAASERIASAIEERNAVERAERERYINPWTMQRGEDRFSRWYTFVLGGDEPITDVTIEADEADQAREQFSISKPKTDRMRPGESMTVTWIPTMASESQVSVELHWKRPAGDEHHTVVTLN